MKSQTFSRLGLFPGSQSGQAMIALVHSARCFQKWKADSNVDLRMTISNTPGQMNRSSLGWSKDDSFPLLSQIMLKEGGTSECSDVRADDQGQNLFRMTSMGASQSSLCGFSKHGWAISWSFEGWSCLVKSVWQDRHNNS